MTLVEKFLHLQEMGMVTISVGCNILRPIFTKSISSDQNEIRATINKIFKFGEGGKVVFCDNDKNAMDKKEWIRACLHQLAEETNQQLEINSNIIEEIFIAKESFK